MVQVAAALLFTLAAGLGITVILSMLRSNENAILSALLGEGAFPIVAAPEPGPAPRIVPLRQSAARREPARRLSSSMAARPQLSRAA